MKHTIRHILASSLFVAIIVAAQLAFLHYTGHMTYDSFASLATVALFMFLPALAMFFGFDLCER